MRLLLTGFEPFGGETVNPSEEIVRAIAADPPGDIDLTTRVLPVQLDTGVEHLIPALSAEPYDAWLGLGEAGGRAHLSVERVGINLFVDSAQPAELREEQTIIEDGPAAYFSRLPQASLAQRMRAAGAPTAVSTATRASTSSNTTSPPPLETSPAASSTSHTSRSKSPTSPPAPPRWPSKPRFSVSAPPSPPSSNW